jgi:hypothetical protein
MSGCFEQLAFLTLLKLVHGFFPRASNGKKLTYNRETVTEKQIPSPFSLLNTHRHLDSVSCCAN